MKMEKKPTNPNSEIAVFVRSARTALDLTQEQFADRYNCTKGNVSAWENGRHEPAFALLRQISIDSGIALPKDEVYNEMAYLVSQGESAFSFVNARDALSDGGTVFSSHQRGAVQNGAIPPGENRLPIRRAKFKLSAGVSGYEVEYENGESEPIYMGKRWFESHHYRADKLIAVKVTGRSMEPSLYDGDLVVINTEDVALKDGEVFAANYDGELVIKRLRRDAGQWYLSSDSSDKLRFGDKLCSEGCGLIGRIVYKQSEHI